MTDSLEPILTTVEPTRDTLLIVFYSLITDNFSRVYQETFYIHLLFKKKIGSTYAFSFMLINAKQLAVLLV